MTRRLVRSLLLLGLLVPTIGCHTMRFEVGSGPVSEVVYDRKSFYLVGLAPTRKVDVSKHCPNGVVAIREEITFLDGLFALLTLDVWTPRSSWYYCAAENG